jgi:hypothetical protein
MQDAVMLGWRIVGAMKEQIGRYRRPGQSSYAKGGWWVANFAELVGGVGGFVVGFLLLVASELVAPQLDLGWVPFVTTIVGAFGLRALVKRPPRR